MEMRDVDYMRLAIRLAKRGAGRTSPNPMVGAVIVRDGKIIARGYHHFCGGAHAERDAINSCTTELTGATMYVTLEPCCHYGRTPPCADYIIQHKIARVVVGSDDPNPLVAGGGIARLREAGIDVTTGVLKDECDQLNEVFFYYIRTHLPFVVMKYAMTADGKSAAHTSSTAGDTQSTNPATRITGAASLHRVHRDRARYTAIMTGVGTVIADDPLLTCRIPRGRNPVRIICDTSLRTPLDSRIASTTATVRTIIATSCTDEQKRERYRNAGFELLTVPSDGAHIDLSILMQKLGELTIDSVYLEAGSRLAASALKSGIVQKIHVYVAPKMYCGSIQSPVMGNNVLCPCAMSLKKVTKLGEDILLEYGGVTCLPE